MKCPKCGKDVRDNISLCPYCGAVLHQESPNVVPNSGEVITPQNFRDLPTYKPRLMKMFIFASIALVFCLLGLFGSLLMRFIDPVHSETAGLVLFLIGIFGGFPFIVSVVYLNKKVFPQVNGVKIKGFFEIFTVIALSLSLCAFAVALVLQGIYFVVY